MVEPIPNANRFATPNGIQWTALRIQRNRYVGPVMKQPVTWPELIALALGVYILRAADPADTSPDLHLIPWPKSVEPQNGRFDLTSATRIVAEDERLLPLATVLAQELKLLTELD